jgi:predicted NodU family carbamoyl transferase
MESFVAVLGIGSEIHPTSFLLIQATSLPATQKEERLRGRRGHRGSPHRGVEGCRANSNDRK